MPVFSFFDCPVGSTSIRRSPSPIRERDPLCDPEERGVSIWVFKMSTTSIYSLTTPTGNFYLISSRIQSCWIKFNHPIRNHLMDNHCHHESFGFMWACHVAGLAVVSATVDRSPLSVLEPFYFFLCYSISAVFGVLWSYRDDLDILPIHLRQSGILCQDGPQTKISPETSKESEGWKPVKPNCNLIYAYLIRAV